MDLISILLCVVSISTTISAFQEHINCSAPGLICKSCSVSIMCVKIGNQYIESNQRVCSDGQSCLAGSCTDEVNPACDYKDLRFPCQYQGVYPHPGDWTKYVVCIRDKADVIIDYEQQCETGVGYNALTTYCNIDLKNIDLQTFPIERCHSENQYPKPLLSNPSIYYHCAPHPHNGKLYPFLAACPEGGIYRDGECHARCRGVILNGQVTCKEQIEDNKYKTIQYHGKIYPSWIVRSKLSIKDKMRTIKQKSHH